MEIKQVMVYGAITMSVLTSLVFLVSLLIAFMSKDQANLELIYGAVISNFTTSISFWLGSSAGSQKKDDVMQTTRPVVPPENPHP
jgi:ABC-type uncharacterized transport system permease subunit